MILVAIFLAAGFLVGWAVAPLRRALATSTAVWLAMTAWLGLSWTIWDDTAEDVVWFFVVGGLMLVGMIGFSLLGSGLKAKSSTPA